MLVLVSFPMTERARAGLGAGAKQEHGESGKHERRKNTRHAERLRARAGKLSRARAGWSQPAFGPERLHTAFAIWGNHLRRLSGELNLTQARLRWLITSKKSAMGVLSVSCFLESCLPRPTIRALRVIRDRTFFVEREQEHEPPFTIHRFPSSRLPDSR